MICNILNNSLLILIKDLMVQLFDYNQMDYMYMYICTFYIVFGTMSYFNLIGQLEEFKSTRSHSELHFIVLCSSAEMENPYFYTFHSELSTLISSVAISLQHLPMEFSYHNSYVMPELAVTTLTFCIALEP